MRVIVLLTFTGLVFAQGAQRHSVVMARVFPQPGQVGLFIAAADGSGERPLVTPADLDYDAAWAPDGSTIVFTSESIENIPAGFRARETYKILGPDEFTEVFEIAEPGKDFEVYSEAHFKRKK